MKGHSWTLLFSKGPQAKKVVSQYILFYKLIIFFYVKLQLYLSNKIPSESIWIQVLKNMNKWTWSLSSTGDEYGTDVGTLWRSISAGVVHRKDRPDVNVQRGFWRCTCWEVTFRGYWSCTKREQIKYREKRVRAWIVYDQFYGLVVSFNGGFYCSLYKGVNMDPWILL